MFTLFKDYTIRFAFGNKAAVQTVSTKPEIIEPFHFSVGNKDFHTFLTTKDYLSLLAEVYTEYKVGNQAIATYFEKEMSRHLDSPANILIICNIIYQHKRLEYKHHAAFPFSSEFIDLVRSTVLRKKSELMAAHLEHGNSQNYYQELIYLHHNLTELCGSGLFD